MWLEREREKKKKKKKVKKWKSEKKSEKMNFILFDLIWFDFVIAFFFLISFFLPSILPLLLSGPTIKIIEWSGLFSTVTLYGHHSVIGQLTVRRLASYYRRAVRSAKQIDRTGALLIRPCLLCYNHGYHCIVSPLNGSFRCSNCVRHGRSCNAVFFGNSATDHTVWDVLEGVDEDIRDITEELRAVESRRHYYHTRKVRR